MEPCGIVTHEVASIIAPKIKRKKFEKLMIDSVSIQQFKLKYVYTGNQDIKYW
jgi:hypothetical protein